MSAFHPQILSGLPHQQVEPLFFRGSGISASDADFTIICAPKKKKKFFFFFFNLIFFFYN